MRTRQSTLEWAFETPLGFAALTALVTAATLTFGLSLMYVQAKYEAQSFNKITGSNVTTWDALWVELRIDRPTTN